jgi:hypothetical protein
MTFPADAIVDAETGCLLRLISYAGDTLATWSELDDISTEPADPDEFRVHIPPAPPPWRKPATWSPTPSRSCPA